MTQFLKDDLVGKGERAGWPEEVTGNHKRWCKSVDLGKLQLSRCCWGMFGAVLWEHSLEEASCDQEVTTQVCNIKNPPSLSFILRCRPLVCFQGQHCGVELPLPLLIERQVRVGSLDQFISVYGAFTVGVSVVGRISETHHSVSWAPESNGAWLAFDTASRSTFTQRRIWSVAPCVRSCARLYGFYGEPNRHSSYPQGLAI